MARKPRIVAEPQAPEPTPVLEPWPLYCHLPTGCRTRGKVFARLTFKSAAGLIWSEGSCQGDQQFRADQIRAEGGELVEVLVLEGEGA